MRDDRRASLHHAHAGSHLACVAIALVVTGCPKAIILERDAGVDARVEDDAGPGDAGQDAGVDAGSCDVPYGDCVFGDGIMCETNLSSDEENCGACGHSCLGSRCTSAHCAPVLIGGDPDNYTGLFSLYGIVHSNGMLFGTNWYQDSGMIYRLPVDGNPDLSVTFTAKGPIALDGMVGGFPDGTSAMCAASPMITDGTGAILFGVFRAEPNCPDAGIWELRSDGTLLRNVVTLDPGQEIAAIAADQTYVYYSLFWRFGSPTGLYRADRGTGANEMRFLMTARIDTIFADGEAIYFADQANNTIYAAEPDTLSTPVPLATTVDAPGNLQADDTYLYYQDQGRFYRVDKLGLSLPEDITPPGGLMHSPIRHFMVDDTYIYYVAGMEVSGQQRIYAFRKDMTSTRVDLLASVASDWVSALTQDATALYWTTYGSGADVAPTSAIWRLAKPAR